MSNTRAKGVIEQAFGPELKEACCTAEPCETVDAMVDALDKDDIELAKQIASSLDSTKRVKAAAVSVVEVKPHRAAISETA